MAERPYLKVRQGGRVISVAAIIALGLNPEGKREILGLSIGPSEAKAFWVEFLRSLVARGLSGVQWVISDGPVGLKAVIVQVLGATWQRCRVHFTRNLHAGVPRDGAEMVAAWLRQVFSQPDWVSAKAHWRQVVDQLRSKFPQGRGLDGRGRGLGAHELARSLPYPAARHHSAGALELKKR